MRGHVLQLKNQFSEVEGLKKKLQSGHILTIMDYIENFVCRFQDEPSALFYGAVHVTLHPMVAHLKKGEEI